MSYKRGDVCYYDFGYNPGSVQSSYRPCLIVGNNKQNYSSKICVVVPITSASKKSIPTHVPIPDGYPIHGTILCEQLFTVNKQELEVTSIHMPEDVMKQVDQSLSIELYLSSPKTKEDWISLKKEIEQLQLKLVKQNEIIERYQQIISNDGLKKVAIKVKK